MAAAYYYILSMEISPREPLKGPLFCENKIAKKLKIRHSQNLSMSEKPIIQY